MFIILFIHFYVYYSVSMFILFYHLGNIIGLLYHNKLSIFNLCIFTFYNDIKLYDFRMYRFIALFYYYVTFSKFKKTQKLEKRMIGAYIQNIQKKRAWNDFGGYFEIFYVMCFLWGWMKCYKVLEVMRSLRVSFFDIFKISWPQKNI